MIEKLPIENEFHRDLTISGWIAETVEGFWRAVVGENATGVGFVPLEDVLPTEQEAEAWVLKTVKERLAYYEAQRQAKERRDATFRYVDLSGLA